MRRVTAAPGGALAAALVSCAVAPSPAAGQPPLAWWPLTPPPSGLVVVLDECPPGEVRIDDREVVVGPLVGGCFFTVPADLVNTTATLTVGARAAPIEIGPEQPGYVPIVEGEMLFGVEADPSGLVRGFVYLQVANADTATSFTIDDEPAPSVAHRFHTPRDPWGPDAAALARPKHHRLAFLVGFELPGCTDPACALAACDVPLEVVGVQSNGVAFAHALEVPCDPARLDSDRDGLLDVVEPTLADFAQRVHPDAALRRPPVQGEIDGTCGVASDPPLAHRPDLLVEVDIAPSVALGAATGTFRAVRDAFLQAPILAPMGTGVEVGFNCGGRAADVRSCFPGFCGAGCALDPRWVDRPLPLPPGARQRHVAIHDAICGTHPGYALGNRVLLSSESLGLLGTSSEWDLAARLFHELGHTLGLTHAGPTSVESAAWDRGPSYSSMMNYDWMDRHELFDCTLRAQRPICTRLYYGGRFRTECEGTRPLPPMEDGVVLPGPLAFSDGMLPSQDEACLLERPGICGGRTDWAPAVAGQRVQPCVGEAPPLGGPATYAGDLNSNGSASDVLRDHGDWHLLEFDLHDPP